MKPEEIQAEWDAFIEYPEGSGKLYVTTTSALIFARSIVEMAEKRERDKLRTQNQALVEALEAVLSESHDGPLHDDYRKKARAALAQAEGGV